MGSVSLMPSFDFAIRSEAEKGDSESSGGGNGTLVSRALDFEVGRNAIRDVRVRRLDVDVCEEVSLHEREVASRMIARDADVFIEIERHDVAKTVVLARACRLDARVHSEWRVAGRETEDDFRIGADRIEQDRGGAFRQRVIIAKRFPVHGSVISVSSVVKSLYHRGHRDHRVTIALSRAQKRAPPRISA